MRIFYTQVHNLIGFFELKYMLKLKCKNSRFKAAKKAEIDRKLHLNISNSQAPRRNEYGKNYFWFLK